jgi:hypothetical protein
MSNRNPVMTITDITAANTPAKNRKGNLLVSVTWGFSAGPIKRRNVLQPVIVPKQQEQVREQHERDDAGSIKPRSMGQHKDVQDDGEVEDRSHKRCSWNEQQQRRSNLGDSDERIVETRFGAFEKWPGPAFEK